MISSKIQQLIKDNIFSASQAAINDYAVFNWHKGNDGAPDTYKKQSSQAVAIDFWGLVKNSRYKDGIINLLFTTQEKEWNVIFEYVDLSLLNERISTQIDVVLQSENVVFLIESKFKENDAGSCSMPKLNKNNIRQCNKGYKKQLNPLNSIESKCALTGKEIKYWDYIPKIYKFKKEDEYARCPFSGHNYQWMRNLCFARAMEEKSQRKVLSYFIYYDSMNCPISKKITNRNYLEDIRGSLINQNSIQLLTYNQSNKKIIQYFEQLGLNDEKEKWMRLELWLQDKAIQKC